MTGAGACLNLPENRPPQLRGCNAIDVKEMNPAVHQNSPRIGASPRDIGHGPQSNFSNRARDPAAPTVTARDCPAHLRFPRFSGDLAICDGPVAAG